MIYICPQNHIRRVLIGQMTSFCAQTLEIVARQDKPENLATVSLDMASSPTEFRLDIIFASENNRIYT